MRDHNNTRTSWTGMQLGVILLQRLTNIVSED